MDDLIGSYFFMGLSYKDILWTLSQKHRIIISLRHLKRKLKEMKLFRHKNYSSAQEVVHFVRGQLTCTGALLGYRMMYYKCLEAGLRVKKEDIRTILAILDAEGVAIRKSGRLSRRAYFAKGPNFIWHVDSYDKLKPFGLCINGCIDGFSRKLMWLNVYNTSSDPRIIAGYFIETVEKNSGCPVVVRCDMGTENCSVRDLQRYLRRSGNDSFAGSRSFLYGASTGNQRIESYWGSLRRQRMEFWICIFHNLKDNGYFDGEFVDKNLIQFSFLGMVQDELDDISRLWDAHVIRPSKNENVPYGRPKIMYSLPELYGTQNCICPVESHTDMELCKRNCVFRQSVPCDIDVFKICSIIMAERNLKSPTNADDAIKLYLTLREIVRRHLF